MNLRPHAISYINARANTEAAKDRYHKYAMTMCFLIGNSFGMVGCYPILGFIGLIISLIVIGLTWRAYKKWDTLWLQEYKEWAKIDEISLFGDLLEEEQRKNFPQKN